MLSITEMRLHECNLHFDCWQRDKLSITTTAAREVEELKKRREEMERRRSEMKRIMRARESSSSSTSEESEMDEARIRIKVEYPSSGVDSMLEVLKCLKQTSSNIRLINSSFSPQQFSAALGIQTKVGFKCLIYEAKCT